MALVRITLFGSWLLLAAAFTAAGGGTNWMAPLNGSLLLSQLSIPGSHDTMALFEPFPGTAKCQNLALSSQLAAGVRFLDIRCRHVKNAFAIYHGSVYQNASFDDVLNPCATFLSQNPGECIIMSVKEEYTPEGNTRTFEQTFDSYVSKKTELWHLSSAIPTLGSVRGKIVLFRRFAASALRKGIDGSVWPDNRSFTNGNLIVEDRYEFPDNDTKWREITNLLHGAVSGSKGTLYVTFASGYQKRAFGIPDIPVVADDVNHLLANYFRSHDTGRYGIVLMDFVDEAHCAQIIR